MNMGRILILMAVGENALLIGIYDPIFLHSGSNVFQELFDTVLPLCGMEEDFQAEVRSSLNPPGPDLG